MSPAETSEACQKFIETSVPCRTALSWLAPGAEIAVEIGEVVSLTLVNGELGVQALDRQAVHPVLLVRAKPQAAEFILSQSGLNTKKLSEVLVKQVLAGGLQIRREASWFRISKLGVMGMFTNIFRC